jgi:hypothetical protein
VAGFEPATPSSPNEIAYVLFFELSAFFALVRSQLFTICTREAGPGRVPEYAGERNVAGAVLTNRWLNPASRCASIGGHTALREVERYVKAADRERMARIDMAAIANVRLATKAIPFFRAAHSQRTP